MRPGQMVSTPCGPALLDRIIHAAVVRDQALLKRIWDLQEIRPIPEETAPDEEAEEAPTP
jgi:hypothetical protein